MFCAAVYPETRGAELLAAWRDFMVTAPKQLSSLAEFSTIPDDPEYPEEARGVLRTGPRGGVRWPRR